MYCAVEIYHQPARSGLYFLVIPLVPREAIVSHCSHCAALSPETEEVELHRGLVNRTSIVHVCFVVCLLD